MEGAEKGCKAVRESKAKRKRSTDHNPEECPVCMTVYDDTVHRPGTLPCGNSVCTMCVNKLKQQGRVACPKCRDSHAVPEGGQFPVNYAVEDLIKKKRDAEAVTAAAAGQKEAAGLSRKVHSFLQEQEAPVVAAITACQEVQAQLNQYQTTLRGWGEQQEQLKDSLQGLLDQSSRSVRELLQQEESRAAAKKKEAREGQRQLHAVLTALRTPATEQEARVTGGEVLRCTVKAKEMLEECQGSFPDANTATTVMKETEASKAALMAFQAALMVFQADQAALEAHPSVAEEEARPQPEAESTIVDRLQAILTPSLKGPLQAKDLRSPTQPVMRLLETGRVFGVHQVEGQRRHASISLVNGKLYLHSLKKGLLPPGASTISVSQVVPPKPPCTVFLDLSWPGTMCLRVHIRLSPDTPRGRQMVLLCTGQLGPSYAGTHLFKVYDKGQPGERVYGGDYESNDGKGGAALVPDLHKGKYRDSSKAGAVFGYAGDCPSNGAVFSIITRDNPVKHCDVFGEVVLGLEAVVAAAKHTPITEVTVMDCGVVLWG